MDTVEIFFAKTKEGAKLPSKRPEDAGYDVYVLLDGEVLGLAPHETALLPTGIASACPPDYFFRIAERGSTGTKGIGQRCGVIDSGYRGEWFIPVTNHNELPLYFVRPDAAEKLTESLAGEAAVVYKTDKAVCQALLLPVPKTSVRELSYDELCAIASERGAGKLGSSRK